MVERALQSARENLAWAGSLHRGMVRKKHANYFLICAYTLCVALEGWTSNAINAVLIDIAGNIGASSDETSWIITVYSAAAAVTVVCSHAICRVTGERLYILLCALLFSVASAGCAMSESLAFLLAFRILQGLAAGAFMSRTLVLLVTHFDAAIRFRPLRYYLLILFIIGRLLAPVGAGLMTDWFSWRSFFWMDALGALIAAWFFTIAPLHEKLVPPPSRRRMEFDWLGAGLLIVGVAGVQIVLSRGEVDNWLGSPLIRMALITGLAAHVGFLFWQFSPANRRPLVHLRHLFTRGLFSVAWLGVLLGTLFAAVVYAVPFYLRLSEVHSATQCGTMLSIIGIPMVLLAILAPYYGKFVGMVGGRAALTIGLLMELVSALLMIYFLTSDTPDIYFIIPLALSGAFIAVTAVGLALAGFASVPVKRISNARTLYFGARQLGNSLGISLGIVLLDRREVYHSERIFESYFTRNLGSERMVVNFQSALHTRSFGAAVAHQSVLLSYQDFYVAVAVLCVVTMLCTLLLPGHKRPQRTEES